MSSFKFRPQRGGLSEAMAEVKTFQSKNELVDFIIESLKEFGHGCQINEDTVKIMKYVEDKRIGWDTHIVTLEGYGVFGFTDKAVESKDR